MGLTQYEMPFERGDEPKAEPFARMDELAKLPVVYHRMFTHLWNGLGIIPAEAIRMCIQAYEQDQIVQRYRADQPKKITSKRQFYRMFENERFGNRQEFTPVWKSEHWFAHGESQHPPFNSGHPLWALRYKEPGYRQWSCYDLPPREVWPTYRDWIAEGADPDKFNLTPMMPDEHIVVQGEIQFTVTGWEFRLSKMKRPMNESLNGEPWRLTGPSGWMYLKLVMDPESYEDIRSILDDFEGAVVEFSTYDINVGSVKGRNTIVWEVRNY